MGIYRATIVITSPILGGTGTNTFHLRTTEDGPVGAGQAEVLTEILHDFYESMKFYGITTTLWKWDGNLQGVGPDEGEFLATDPWTVTGAASTGTLPPANAICINWRGLSGDRSRRGRTFYGPVALQPNDGDGTIKTADLTSMRQFADELVSASLADLNGAIGVWSRQESVLRDFAASSVRDQFAVLTSRRD